MCIRHWTQSLCLHALCGLAACAVSFAETLVNDPFSDGAVSNGADAQDVAWSATNANLSIVQYNSTGSNTGNAMRISPTAGYQVVKTPVFAGRQLQVGQAMQLWLEFRMPSSVPNGTSNLRFGLGSAAATYGVNFGTGTSASTTIHRYLANAVSGTSTALTVTGTPISLNSTANHELSLLLVRTSPTTLAIAACLDGVFYTASDTGVSNFTFDRVLFGTGSVTVTANLDNVRVDHMISPFGVSSSDGAIGSYSTFLPQLNAAKVRGMRSFPNWSGIQPTSGGGFSWGFVDTRIDDFAAQGIETSGLFIYAVGWNNGGLPVKHFPTNLTAYRDYAKAAAGRYPEITYWEVWNEPNSNDFNPGLHSAATYAQLVINAYEGAKDATSGNPNAKIGITCANFDLMYLKQVISSLNAAGKGHCFDFIAIHPYGSLAACNATDGEMNYLDMVDEIRDALATLAPSKVNVPIRVTEVGAKLNDFAVGEQITENVQARLLAKAYVLGIAQGVEQTQWFEVKDGGENFGMYSSSMVQRVAYQTYRATTGALGSFPNYRGWVQIGTGGRGYGFVFENGTQNVLACWMPKGHTAAVLNFATAVDVVDIYANTTTSATSVSVGEKPVFIKNVPSTYVTDAAANLSLPYPWGSEPINSNLGQVLLGASPLGNAVEWNNPETGTKLAGQGGVTVGHLNELHFRINPRFIDTPATSMYVRVTAKKTATTSSSSGMNLYYAGVMGTATASPQIPYFNRGIFWTLANNTNLQTFSWSVPATMFAEPFGRNFNLRFEMGATSGITVTKVEVSKVPF